ncbi:hypothetical protein ACKFKG_14620 [Phormidesmis sp. 146-35]
MELKIFSLSLLSLSAMLTLASSSTPPALAQCVMADVSVQAAIRGSKKPVQQTNDVEMQSKGACVGNTSVHTGTQLYVGGGDKVIQRRNSKHRLEGGSSPVTGVVGPTVKIPVNVQVDVYNPAERLNR